MVGRIEDAAGHEPRMRRSTRAARIRRVADRPARALAAGVHDEMDEAGLSVDRLLVRQAASAAVAEELDDGRYRAAGPDGPVEPAADPVSAEPAERDIERLDQGQAVVDALERRREIVRPRLRQRRLPERIEVGGLREVRRVPAKLARAVGRNSGTSSSIGQGEACEDRIRRRSASAPRFGYGQIDRKAVRCMGRRGNVHGGTNRLDATTRTPLSTDAEKPEGTAPADQQESFPCTTTRTLPARTVDRNSCSRPPSRTSTRSEASASLVAARRVERAARPLGATAAAVFVRRKLVRRRLFQRRRQLRQRRWWWWQLRSRSPRDVHRNLLVLRQGGLGPLPPHERQARLLQRLLPQPARLDPALAAAV